MKDPTQPKNKNAHPKTTLTKDELQILSAMASGLTKEEIAVEMNLPVPTIKSLCNSIFFNLGVTNRIDAIRVANEMSIAHPNSALTTQI